jgi:antitoxin component of MazEF toxin-antitoxin module
MIEFNANLRKWGRSFGIVIPIDKLREINIKENEEIEVKVIKKDNPLRKTFGLLKFKRTTKEILDESDKEGWDE